MSTEYEWNGLRVRRNENGKWEYRIRGGHVWVHCDANIPGTAIAAELDKLYPLPIEPPEPPEPGTIVHLVGSDHWATAAMKFIGVDPDDPHMWIVRDGRDVLDVYAARWLALGPGPESDDR